MRASEIGPEGPVFVPIPVRNGVFWRVRSGAVRDPGRGVNVRPVLPQVAPSAIRPFGALAEWPIDRPRDWTARVNRPFGPKEEEAVRRSIERGQPFGSAPWKAETAARLGLESAFRPRGHPRKSEAPIAPAADVTDRPVPGGIGPRSPDPRVGQRGT